MAKRPRGKKERVVSVLTKGHTQVETTPVTYREHPIAWGIPMDEVLFSKFFQGFIRGAHMMPWDAFLLTECTYLPDARNEIHNAFLTRSNATHLMMLDSDILFPPHTADILLAHDLPVVCGWYRNKHPKGPPHPIVYDYAGTVRKDGKHGWTHREEAGTGLEKVGGVGMGCVLMSRDAAITLGSTPYSTQDGGEDLAVCKKLIDAGVDVHVDWNVNCIHLGVGFT